MGLVENLGSLVVADDYADFAVEDFDVDEYANKVIRAPEGVQFHRADIAAALSKLTFSIEHLNKQLHDQVTTHYEDLLGQLSGLGHFDSALSRVNESATSLNNSFQRVKTKVREAHDQIQGFTNQLETVQEAAEILRRVRRFLYLVRRLDSQLPQKELANAALTINEIDVILSECDLSGIDVVDSELPRITSLKSQIVSQAESQIHQGLSAQEQTEVAVGLQVFHNLGQLSSKTHSIIDKMLEAVTKEAQSALHAAALDREVNDVSSADKRRPELPVLNAPIYAAALWKRLEKLVDVMYDTTVKVYVLERVLARKRDPLTFVSFLDIVVKSMDGNIVKYYWRVLSHSFEKELKVATKASAYLHQIFHFGYPKLLRLFHDFFSRLEVFSGSYHAVSVTSPTVVKAGEGAIPFRSEEPTIADTSSLLRSLLPFETAYLRESLARLLDPINTAFPDKAIVGMRPIPTKDDVDKVLRTLSRELDVAKFDKHLLKAVSKNVAKALSMYSIRSEHAVATDSTAYQFSASGSASSSQLLNIEITNCVWNLSEGAWKVMEEFSDEYVVSTLRDSVETLNKVILSIIEPLLGHLTRDIENIILKIHKEDYKAGARPTQPQQRPGASITQPQDSTSSTYVLEVSNKLRWAQREIMARFQCGDDTRIWVCSVASRILDFFLRQASLVRPLSEVGKLRLTSDMTQLEFGLSQWVSLTGMKLEVAVGESYRALRAFRQLLFLDLAQLTATHHTSALRPLIVAHHLIVRADPVIPLPMTAFNWTEAQYSEWLDSHSESDGADLLSRCVDSYTEEVRRKGEKQFTQEYPILRSILSAALKK